MRKSILFLALGLMMTLGAQAAKEVYTVFNEMSTINYQLSTKKILRNGQLFIQHGDELFNAQGARVK